MTFGTQNFIVQKPVKKKHKAGALDVPASLWNPDGSSFVGVKLTAISLYVDDNGKLSGGLATLSDDSTLPVTIVGTPPAETETTSEPSADTKPEQ